MNLKEIVARNLRLDERPRAFVISVSGGGDSTVLAHLMRDLSKEYPIALHLLHLNFQLRGEESKGDEKFVRQMAKRLQIPLTVKRVTIRGSSAIQERARELRLKSAKTVQPDWELLEAHQLDDQMETFFLRLFRGAGPLGLSGMKPSVWREGRRVFRPLLEVSKRQLRFYAKQSHIQFREDSSNRKSTYDRNWIRLKLLPLIEKRFRSARVSLSRALQILSEQSEVNAEAFEGDLDKIIQSKNPLILNWRSLKELSSPRANDFLYLFFKRHLNTQVHRRHIVELTKAIQDNVSFSFNAPKKIVVKGRRESGTVKSPELRFYQATSKGLNPLGVTISDSTLY